MAEEKARDPTMPERKPVNIPLSKIHDLPGSVFAPPSPKSLEALTSSIVLKGIQEPIILRQREDGEFQIVSGNRRRKASELAKKTEIPAFVYGKTRFLAKPNLMLANASFIVTDPKGEMLRAVGNLFLEEGYVLRVFDLIDPAKSDCYNPFCYIRKDADVFKLIDNFIKNTTPKGAKANDPFWEKSETALDAALMLYLLHEAPEEDQNMETILYMIENGGAKEEDDDYQSPLDLLFEALEEEQPDHIAVRQYHIFKQAAGKTAKSILVSAAVRLASFTLPEIQRITGTDDMELGKLGERKQAIFCIIPDSNDASLNFLVGMLYTQAFQELYFQADKVHHGALPVPVRLMFDEFANGATRSTPKTVGITDKSVV